MEIVGSVSAVALAAVIINGFIDLFRNWYSSYPVQQALNFAIMLREVLPPMVVDIIRSIIVIIAANLHVMIHSVVEILVALRHFFHFTVFMGKGLYMVLRGFNEMVAFVANLPQTLFGPFWNWIQTPPVQVGNLWIIGVLLTVGIVTYKIKPRLLRYLADKSA